MAYITVLDSSGGDAGPAQTMKATNYYSEQDRPIRFIVSIGSGDTVLIQGSKDASTWNTLETITASGEYDVFVNTLYWRANRSVDGGSADSTVDVDDSRYTTLVADE